MINARVLRRLSLGLLFVALLAGITEWVYPSNAEAQPDCVWATWEGRWSNLFDSCEIEVHRNCSYVGVSCPPAM